MKRHYGRCQYGRKSEKIRKGRRHHRHGCHRWRRELSVSLVFFLLLFFSRDVHGVWPHVLVLVLVFFCHCCFFVFGRDALCRCRRGRGPRCHGSTRGRGGGRRDHNTIHPSRFSDPGSTKNVKTFHTGSHCSFHHTHITHQKRNEWERPPMHRRLDRRRWGRGCVRFTDGLGATRCFPIHFCSFLVCRSRTRKGRKRRVKRQRR